MPPRLALLLAAGAAGGLGTAPAALPGGAGAACAAGGAGACPAASDAVDEVGLLQHRPFHVVEIAASVTKVQRAEAHWPDFGNIVESAQGLKDDLAAKAVSSVGTTIGSLFTALRKQVDQYATQVNSSAKSLELGMAALLAKSLNVSIDTELAEFAKSANESFDKATAIAETYASEAKDLIDRAVATFKQATSSMGGAAKAAKLLPSGFGDIATSLNATLQAALAKVGGVEEALVDVQTLVERGHPPSASTVQTSGHKRERLHFHLEMDQIQFFQEEAEVSVRFDAHEVLRDLAAKLKRGGAQVDAFAEGFGQSFHKLSDSIQTALKGKVGEKTLAKVSQTFEELADSAQGMADQAAESTHSLLGKIRTSAVVVSEKSAATAAAPARLGLAALLLAALMGRS